MNEQRLWIKRKDYFPLFIHYFMIKKERSKRTAIHILWFCSYKGLFSSLVNSFSFKLLLLTPLVFLYWVLLPFLITQHCFPRECLCDLFEAFVSYISLMLNTGKHQNKKEIHHIYPINGFLYICLWYYIIPFWFSIYCWCCCYHLFNIF